MIEINLVPGSTRKGSGRRKAGRKAGGGGARAVAFRMPEFDRTRGMIIAGWVLAIAIVGYLHLSTNSKLSALRAENEAAVRDSTRFATLRAHGDSLLAQERLIAQKMQVIQQIDAGRFIWAHILDEVSRALPAYVWIASIEEASNENGLPRIRVEARAGNYFALARYIEDLEGSPFLQQVRLLQSSQTQVDNRTVLSFTFEAAYQEPPPDAITTVPLFGTTEQEE